MRSSPQPHTTATPDPIPFHRAQLGIAAVFCLLGFQYATWASRLPALTARLDLSEARLGLLLMACGASAAASFPLVTVLMERLGSRRLLLLSAPVLALLLPALALAPNYPAALVVICCDGIAVGCLNVAMNAQGAALEAAHGRTAMARLHAAFSGGALLASLLASGVTTFTSDLPAHFGLACVLLLLSLAWARPRLLPDESHRGGEKTRRSRAVASAAALWMGAAMAFATITEGAMNDWSALYLDSVAGASEQVAPLGIAVVSVTMVTARLFADGLRSRWGDGRVVRVGSALAGTGLALALLTGGITATLIGFACVGLGAAAVTPCVYVAAARRGPDALALVAAMGTTGLLAGPALIGFIASAGNLVWGMAAVAASALLVTLCATRITWQRPAPENFRSKVVPAGE
ncbi:MFS transporter [Streptomyces sp. NPDC029216]|uniref:MFS transporter n=1 Tax=Streptomyces sp. NPDC029216 TaxID=3154701 RepID=UPI0033CD828B